MSRLINIKSNDVEPDGTTDSGGLHDDRDGRDARASSGAGGKAGLPVAGRRFRRHYTWKDYLRIGAGIVMLCLGVAGLVLPILQGILFLLVGVALLAPYFGPARRIQAWSRQRFPSVHEAADAMVQRLTRRHRR